MCNSKKVNQSDAGLYFGVSSAAIRKWIKSGRLSESVSRDANGFFISIDIELAEIENKKFKGIKGVCKRCNTKLKGKQRSYCDDCRKRYTEVCCGNCLSFFTQLNENQKYCSKSCAYERRLRKTPVEKVIDAVCCVCSNGFNPSSTDAKYCSTECKAIGVAIYKRNCLACDAEFDAKPVQVYCSKECAKLAHNKQRSDSGKQILTALWRRDSFTCIYCGMSSIEDGVKLSSDHIIPLDGGGEHTIDNLVTACKSCNSSKKNKELSVDITKRITDVVAKRNTLLSQAERLSLQNVLKIVRADYVYKRGRWAE